MRKCTGYSTRRKGLRHHCEMRKLGAPVLSHDGLFSSASHWRHAKNHRASCTVRCGAVVCVCLCQHVLVKLVIGMVAQFASCRIRCHAAWQYWANR